MGILVSESYLNATLNHSIGDTGVYESDFDSVGEAYRECRRAYGRCTGHVYIDVPDGKALPIGWVFVKRTKYEDVDDYYLQETWITLHEAPIERVPHYLQLKRRRSK